MRLTTVFALLTAAVAYGEDKPVVGTL